jgi:hypothetical protein
VEIHRPELFNTLMRSLNTIQSAKTQLHLLTASGLTPTVLVSQIKLCDVLLGEIRTISSSLERPVKRRDTTARRSVAVRPEYSSEYLGLPQGSPTNHSKQKKQ